MHELIRNSSDNFQEKLSTCVTSPTHISEAVLAHSSIRRKNGSFILPLDSKLGHLSSFTLTSLEKNAS